MKELTLREAIKALKAGKKIRLNQKNSTPFCLNKEGLFKFDGFEIEEGILIKLGYIDSLCNCISDFENIMNRKGFILVEEPILDDKEKEYLRNVIRPFRDKMKHIVKSEIFFANCSKEYIAIALQEGPIIFPNFEKGTMYKGMKPNKKYTLKELDL